MDSAHSGASQFFSGPQRRCRSFVKLLFAAENNVARRSAVVKCWAHGFSFVMGMH
jgi:hypothetical protein